MAGGAQGLQMARQIGPPAGNADAVAALGQRPDDMPANEARTADDGDQSVGRLNEHEAHLGDEVAGAL